MRLISQLIFRDEVDDFLEYCWPENFIRVAKNFAEEVVCKKQSDLLDDSMRNVLRRFFSLGSNPRESGSFDERNVPMLICYANDASDANDVNDVNEQYTELILVEDEKSFDREATEYLEKYQATISLPTCELRRSWPPRHSIFMLAALMHVAERVTYRKISLKVLDHYKILEGIIPEYAVCKEEYAKSSDKDSHFLRALANWILANQDSF